MSLLHTPYTKIQSVNYESLSLFIIFDDIFNSEKQISFTREMHASMDVYTF